jgi:hypothetical protein
MELFAFLLREYKHVLYSLLSHLSLGSYLVSLWTSIFRSLVGPSELGVRYVSYVGYRYVIGRPQ